jgi:lysozyme
MDISIKGELEIASREGMCLTKYLDSERVWTIGIGSTATEISDLMQWPMSREITTEEAIVMYRHSIRDVYVRGVNHALKVEVNQNQFDALCSICYNIGVEGLTKSTFMRLINKRDNPNNVANAIMLWTKNPELISRRKGEVRLYLEGKYTNNGFTNLFPVDHSGHPMYVRGKKLDLRKWFVEVPPVVVDKAKEVPQVKVEPKGGGVWPAWLTKVLIGF